MLKHSFSSKSLNSIDSIIKSGNIGYGGKVEEFEQMFRFFSNKKYNVATNSASAAAFMIFAYLKEKHGKCDVYVPSLTFNSPVWAAKHHGHQIVFVDINDELQFDYSDYLKKCIQRNSKYHRVVMPTLYGGVSTIDWDSRPDQTVVIDAAHCPHPTIKGDYYFTSFHPTKPICSSDGGMIFTNDKEASDYFYSYRNFGRENTSDGYNVTQNGFKFYMNNLNAVIALESLKDYKDNLETRLKNHNEVLFKFKGRFLQHDEHSSYYFTTLITDKAEEINKKYNLSKHYPLLHKTSYYEDCSLPNTERLHSKIVNLPLYDINIYNS